MRLYRLNPLSQGGSLIGSMFNGIAMRASAALRSTTMLSGVVGAVFFATLPVSAADLTYKKVPDQLVLPAVDGFNGKVEALGGSAGRRGLYGAAGSVSAPLGGQFGAQLDGAAASLAGRSLGFVGGHLFWRAPSKGLLGLYGNYTRWNQFGGVHVAHIAGEGEAYWGRWTLSAVAGAEVGNNASGGLVTTFAGAVATTAPVLTNVSRFYDRLDVSYYLTDDWKAFAGHRYTGGKNALALGTEYAMPLGHGTTSALFAEAHLGEGSNNVGVWGGLRFYFGQHDKSLLRRHREDDPGNNWVPETLFNIADSIGPTTTSTCPSGEIFINGVCSGGVSDIRLKRDTELLARLDNGLGIYRYRYLWSDTVYVGVMAQEVAEIVPDAVMMGADGYFRVDYSKLDMRMLTWDEWVAAQSETALAA
jgi:hypothetical protein